MTHARGRPDSIRIQQLEDAALARVITDLRDPLDLIRAVNCLRAISLGSVVTVHATIPLFDRARPERALALARAAQAEARATAFRLVLRGQIAAFRATVVDRREAAERYRAQAINSADEIERIAQVSYDAGERSILELLDAFRIGTSARVRQAALDAAARQAEIELEFTSGWEIQ